LELDFFKIPVKITSLHLIQKKRWAMQKLLIITIIVFLTGCTVGGKTSPQLPIAENKHIDHKYKGDYSTERIRGMWFMCHNTSQRRQSFPDPKLHAIYCDCFLNETRSTISSAELKVLTQEQLPVFFTVIAQKCRKSMFELKDSLKV